jgi:hypothetical protein
MSVTGQLPPELERRIERLEQGEECGDDFDARSYLWLTLFGVVVPLILWLLGWWV